MKIRLTLGALAGAAALLMGTVAVAGDDAVSALLKAQTQAFSDASLRGDQTVMGGMLDDDVLFSGGSGPVQRDPGRDKTDAVSALLKAQTQAFVDAGLRGDAVVMARYLDDDVLLTNEDGVLSGRRDVQNNAPAASPRGIASTATVTDWVLHYSGDVAVASFTEERLTHYPGQDVNEKFLTIETWIQRGAAWKLLGSQTIPEPQDPPAVSLPSDVLDDYVGTYAGSPVVTIARDGNALIASPIGAKPYALQAEIRDVFFTPGVPGTRRIFQRDASGRITGYVSRSGGGDVLFTKSALAPPPSGSATPQPATPATLTPTDEVVHHADDVAVVAFVDVKVQRVPGGGVLNTKYRSTETWIKRGATWKMIASQTLNLRPDPPAVTLSAEALNDYVGTYAAGPGFTVTIDRDGNALASSTNGEKSVPFEAELRDVFFTPGSWRTRNLFHRDATGRVRGFVRRRDGRDIVFTKEK
jgi:ketosteroid isomerase-like protein